MRSSLCFGNLELVEEGRFPRWLWDTAAAAGGDLVLPSPRGGWLYDISLALRITIHLEMSRLTTNIPTAASTSRCTLVVIHRRGIHLILSLSLTLSLIARAETRTEDRTKSKTTGISVRGDTRPDTGNTLLGSQAVHAGAVSTAGRGGEWSGLRRGGWRGRSVQRTEGPGSGGHFEVG